MTSVHATTVTAVVNSAATGKATAPSTSPRTVNRCQRNPTVTAAVKRATPSSASKRIPAYLEASTPRNRALYLRHGFVVLDEMRLPGGGPPLWRMWREPVA